MKNRRLKGLVLLVVALSLVVLVVVKLHKPQPKIYTPVAATQVIEPKPKKVSHYSVPLRLIIPKAGINAKIQQIGLTREGNLDVPTNTVDVGWYKLGANPGNLGSAVIDGHVNGAYDSHGVFEHLKNLVIGDKIFIKDKNGNQATFAIVTIKDYGNSDHPSEVFKSKDGKHLNLITCDGIWDAKTKLYSKRLVIFADFINV